MSLPQEHSSDEWKAECAEIIIKFLGNIGFELLQIDYNDTFIRNRIRLHFRSEGFSEEYITNLESIIQASAGIAMTTFRFTSPEIQCLIGIYTTYAIAIDDRANSMVHDLKYFAANLLSGKDQPNRFLDSFQRFLKSTCILFGQFGGDMIIKDTVQFIAACYLEVEAKAQLEFPPSAPLFARYFRLKTGVAEAYSFFLFPEEQFQEEQTLGLYLPIIPYSQEYFNYTNDIMSFYKEALESEQSNFVHNSAKLLRVSPHESLTKLCDETVRTAARLRSLGTVSSSVSASIEGLINGYIFYHLSQPRYRLKELGLDIVNEAEHRVESATGAR